MVSFPPVSLPRPYTHPSPHPYTPHAQPISFFSILSPAQYWVRSTDHLAPRYAVSSIPRYLVPPRSKYSPQHHVLKHPQLPFLPQCQRPSFTPIQNMSSSSSSMVFRPVFGPQLPRCQRFETNECVQLRVSVPRRVPKPRGSGCMSPAPHSKHVRVGRPYQCIASNFTPVARKLSHPPNCALSRCRFHRRRCTPVSQLHEYN